MRIRNKRDYMIRISGHHFYACDYVFSNVYGESLFFENDAPSYPADAGVEDLLGEANREENLKDTLPETIIDTLTAMPECTKDIDFMSAGTVIDTRHDGTYIRYGTDEAPMCVHICRDGSVTVSGDEEDLAEIIFEDGKRSLISLQASVFENFPPEDAAFAELNSPLHLGVTTKTISGGISEDGGSLTISYTIDVNGILAEVTDFTLTAAALTKQHRKTRPEPHSGRKASES